MNKALSDKFKVVSLICMILVLYIHSGFRQDEVQGMNVVLSAPKVLSGIIGQLAVPTFFFMSGYLFSRNIHSIGDVTCKMKKRINTLLIPFIIASFAFLSFYVLLEFIPPASKFISSPIVFEELFSSPFKFLYCFFIDVGAGNPLCFQLWFLRDLILIVAISCIIYIASVKVGGVKS